jgi:hypothetical protein
VEAQTLVPAVQTLCSALTEDNLTAIGRTTSREQNTFIGYHRKVRTHTCCKQDTEKLVFDPSLCNFEADLRAGLNGDVRAGVKGEIDRAGLDVGLYLHVSSSYELGTFLGRVTGLRPLGSRVAIGVVL